MKNSIMGAIFKRLIKNEAIDKPIEVFYDEDCKRRSQGCYMFFWTDEDIYRCGAYKLATERYLLKGFFYNKDYLMMDDGRFLLRMPANDVDELYHFTARRKKKLTPKELADQFFGAEPAEAKVYARPTFAYFLMRTVGSLRYNKDADGKLKLYFDDSAESRAAWLREQAVITYEEDFSDPLELPEDGALWSELYQRAASEEWASTAQEVTLIYGLRWLRRYYGARLYMLAGEMRWCSCYRPAEKFLDALLDATSAREWFQATMKEMVSGIDACGTASDEGVASGVGATGRTA